MKTVHFVFGKDAQGQTMARTWSYSDEDQKQKHDIAPPWEDANMQEGGRQLFDIADIPAMQAPDFEPDLEETGWFTKIIKRFLRA